MISRPATTVLVCWLASHSIPALASDDHGDTCATATAIATDGTAVPAIIDPATDEDWLSFIAVASHPMNDRTDLFVNRELCRTCAPPFHSLIAEV